MAEVEASLRGRHREHYLERIFTAAEVEDCRGPFGRIEADRLAARFAAKEAAIKALPGAGEGVVLNQIEVHRREDGNVDLRLSGRAAELLAEMDGSAIAVSLTHERDYAAATVVIA